MCVCVCYCNVVDGWMVELEGNDKPQFQQQNDLNSNDINGHLIASLGGRPDEMSYGICWLYIN